LIVASLKACAASGAKSHRSSDKDGKRFTYTGVQFAGSSLLWAGALEKPAYRIICLLLLGVVRETIAVRKDWQMKAAEIPDNAPGRKLTGDFLSRFLFRGSHETDAAVIQQYRSM
jgi:hypothetical protein